MFGASVPNFTVHAADGPQFIILTFVNGKMKARSMYISNEEKAFVRHFLLKNEA